MRFGVSSVFVFTLMGMAVGNREKTRLEIPPFKTGRIVVMAAVFTGLVLWGNRAVRPLIDRKMLSSEIGFFDSERKWTEEELKIYIKSNPDDSRAYYRLAWIQAQERKFSEAIENFEKTIELDRDNAGAYNNLGNIHYMKGNQSRASYYYKEALKRDPGLADASFNLGYIYYHRGMLEEATKEFERVLRIEPQNYKARTMLERMVQ